MLNTTKQQIETGTAAGGELLGINVCFDVEFHGNQQYSVTAITNSSAGVVERYAYQAYGEPTILDASASVLSSSSISNRYTYTGREWDGTIGLYHFRARWMSGLTGRFLTRDPIATVKNLTREGDLGYLRKPPTIDFDILMQALNLFQYVGSSPFSRVDPSGLLFGFSYGNFCGWDERGQGGPPIDFLDRACKRHDQCQATWWSCNPYHIFKCSLDLCLDADDAVTRGCASDSSNPAKCIEAAKQIKRLFCALAGLPWQDPHNPPVTGGPKF